MLGRVLRLALEAAAGPSCFLATCRGPVGQLLLVLDQVGSHPTLNDARVERCVVCWVPVPLGWSPCFRVMHIPGGREHGCVGAWVPVTHVQGQ